MAKRVYKLQEFIAHASNVNCLKIGKKSCRLLVTGGEDQNVNLWTIGKPNSILSLSGHTTPVECVTFDSAEVLVVAGASSGVIKLWDLEEAKIVRTLTGHRSNCTAIEFHPFGEFFASGSSDSNLRIWDIRKKGCIHTYRGHTRGVSTIRFTPDGRWVVSGGLDNVVKIWDLTAGKLLHDFKFHEGRIQCIDFHPLEFLLATGSADKTVKLWDLETFELIGSAGPEASGVRSMTFHPDGRTLFCGLEDSLKVFSWEPIICHDAVDMGWSTLGDLCIHDGKLLSCSYHQNYVGVWVADISVIGPYGVGTVSRANAHGEQKLHHQESHSVQRAGSIMNSNMGLGPLPEDYETKEIRDIYVDSIDNVYISPRRVGPVNASKVVGPQDSDETSTPLKKIPVIKRHRRSNSEVNNRNFAVPVAVSRNSSYAENRADSRRESISTERSSPILLKPTHIRRQSNRNFDTERLSNAAESGSFSSKTTGLESALNTSLLVEDGAIETSKANYSSIRTVAEKLERVLSLEPPLGSNLKSCEEPLSCSKEISAVKLVSGVVPGRTRSLVERWENREKCTISEAPTPSLSSEAVPETGAQPMLKGDSQTSGGESTSATDEDAIDDIMRNHDVFLSTLRSRITKLQVVRHYWERNDIKGAINAITKLPDQSVQVDVIVVLMEKMYIVTLDVFSSLLPLLIGLLDSKIDRHTNVSLEMLLKLVTVFGPVIRSTMLASPSVGIDLQAEQRRECCSKCYIQLEKIKQVLPSLIGRGGLLAGFAHQLNLVLQE